MLMRVLLIAGGFAALPLSYEWVVAVAVPFVAATLLQSIEALAWAQLLGVALCIGVVMPAVMLCRWIASRLT